MYLSGTQFNFERRLHQLCVNGSDYDSYATEAETYSPVFHIAMKWQRELEKKRDILNLNAEPPTIVLDDGTTFSYAHGRGVEIVSELDTETSSSLTTESGVALAA